MPSLVIYQRTSRRIDPVIVQPLAAEALTLTPGRFPEGVVFRPKGWRLAWDVLHGRLAYHVAVNWDGEPIRG